MMSMGMGMSTSHSQRQEISQRQELTQAQVAEMAQSHELSVRLELLEAIRGFRYYPAGECPSCSRQLTPLEILKGFNENPQDFTTVCTGCNQRFEPRLKHASIAGTMELPFYCSIQALHQLPELQTLNPDELAKAHPAIYHSVIVHHGTLRNAFGKAGVEYHFDEVYEWKTKVVPFLGRLPDTVIAGIVGMTARTIGTLRKKHKIPAYTRESILEEVWDANH